MEPTTLYLIYLAAAGGPEQKVVRPFESRPACEEAIDRWNAETRARGMTVVRAACLLPTDYAPEWRSMNVIIDDSLDTKYRR